MFFLRHYIPTLVFVLALLGGLALCPRATSSAQIPPTPKASVSASVATRPVPAIPPEYGRVIFSSNPAAPNQIYIIGQSHRSPLSGQNGDKTVQSQIEVFRIGEWLFEQLEVGLLLPEGYFRRGRPGRKLTDSKGATPLDRLDTGQLRELLSDTGTFVNADMLLRSRYPFCTAQVEDEALYQDVTGVLRELKGSRSNPTRERLDLLNFYQDKRTAVLLRNIPTAVESAFERGSIRNKKAIFTIGLAHVPATLRFLEEDADLSSFLGDSDPQGPHPLIGLQQDFGVTIILPRTLAEDAEVLRLTRLHEMVALN